VKPPLRIATRDDLEATFRASSDGLHAITRRAGEDQADLAQDAYLKLVETANREPIAAPSHLLYRLARNLVIDRLRSQALRARLFRSDGVDHQLPCPGADPERALLVSERLHCALRVIDAMPSRRREAFLLHRVDGLSYVEIARVMGVSIKTVEKHISAAMLELPRKMKSVEFDR